jgi:uncharacterized membrane protein YozB (DUF420 family)
MKIESTPMLSKIICLVFSSFFLFVMFHLYKMNTLTKENIFVLSFFLSMCFFLLVYMDAHSIEFNKDSVTYSYFAIKKTLLYRDITNVEVNYFHKRIRTITPVLHICEKTNEIEIPYGLFETKFELINQTIHKKVNR